ncbi:MAG: ABC transporter ATP-binding protein [Myxococcota bacterium]
MSAGASPPGSSTASRSEAGPGSAALEAMHEEEALGKAYDARLLRRLWPYVRPYWRQVGLTLLLVGPLFALELAPAWLIKTGLDRVVPAPGEAAGGDVSLLGLGLLYLAVMATLGSLQFLNMVLMARTGQSAMRDLRSDVFRHFQRLHLGFFDRYPIGRLVTRATNDVENVAEMFSAGFVALITDVLKMIGFAVALFLVDADLALVTFAVVPFLAVAAIVFRFRVRAAFRLIRVRIARINTYIQETITGMKVVQLFAREVRNQATFEHLNADHRDAWFTSIRWDSALFSVVEVAGGVTVAIIIWYGTGVAGAGVLYVFIDWMRRFFMPLRDLSAKYSVMQSSMASCERIFQFLDTEPAIVDAPAPAPARPVAGARGAVEFQDVWFAYQGEDWVLRGVSFRVEPGERVALVGATGAGKTTIIQLLTRLYEIQRGRILLDGVELRDLPQSELRRRVAMVLQDVFLFSGTLEENIGLGREDIDVAAIERAARAVEAHSFIERLPRGYQAEVRERGNNFSTGQRQLLSFARALVHGADVLVLDEATSSIDTETEALLQQGIHVLMEGKTAIVIAHRLSTIEDVNRIYVLEAGRIVESGPHAQLLASGGPYARLYRLQYEAASAPPAEIRERVAASDGPLG